MQNVHVYSTLATGTSGVQTYVGGGTAAEKSRKILEESLQRRGVTSYWLKTCHGSSVVKIPPMPHEEMADAAISKKLGVACILTSADCMPVVCVDEDQTCIGIAHSGWRGLANGVIQNFVSEFDMNPHRLHVWIGPSISKHDYEVGQEVFDSIVENGDKFSSFFEETRNGHYLADLKGVARQQLVEAGVVESRVLIENVSTFSNPSFHSTRRDGRSAGRMATIAWIDR
ncbi:peptidoglycan editing factor PgeF [Rhodococcus sp. NPDC059969]|uniref:peptidoglycan editing factor PgeF n=1 Tax=Rhodococcus sp. NPDC059969 TaxID=3347018 RepID=UPI00366BBAAA